MAMRKAAMRNFILQQGFAEPAPAACPVQYSSLQFQPRIVFAWIVVGILFQSSVVFLVLCGVLWWSALFPKKSPFDELYRRTVGKRRTAFPLRPAPAPRRFAQAMAGVFALVTALLIHAGFLFSAYVIEAIFLAAVLALTAGGFCLGSFMYHLLVGRHKFARQTLPWAD